MSAIASPVVAQEQTTQLACGAMVVEPIEPHVVRLIDDGAGHDLTDIDTFEDGKPVSLLSVGDDGSVWLTSSGGFIEIGTPGEVLDPLDTFLAQMEIGPDGTLWIADGQHGSSIGRWRSGSWTIHDLPSTAGVVWLEATPEGGLDLAWRDGSTLQFGALLDGDGSPTIASSPPPLELGSPDGHLDVAYTHDGSTWVAESLWWQDEQRSEPGRLWVTQGMSWRQVAPLGASSETWPTEMVVDGMGRLWVKWAVVMPGTADFGPSGYLTRRDEEDSWTVFSDPDQGAGGGWLLAESHGIWLAPEGWCSGYARFDGEQLTRYLEGLCVRPPSSSPAGDIWLFGHDRARDHAGVYVITPEREGEEGSPSRDCPDHGVGAPWRVPWSGRMLRHRGWRVGGHRTDRAARAGGAAVDGHHRGAALPGRVPVAHVLRVRGPGAAGGCAGCDRAPRDDPADGAAR
jgi:hypothetical protein